MHPLELKLIWNFSLSYSKPLHSSINSHFYPGFGLAAFTSQSFKIYVDGGDGNMPSQSFQLASWWKENRSNTVPTTKRCCLNIFVCKKRKAISATIATSSCFNNIIKTTSTTTSESLANGSGLLLRYAHPIITLWRSTHHQLSPLGHHYTDDKMQNKETNNHQPSLLKRALLCVNACLLASLSYAWSISIHHSVLSCQFSWIILCIRLSYWGPAHIWTGTLGAYSL